MAQGGITRGSRGEWSTPAALAEARALWDAGVTLRDIAAAVGTTRDALIGYAHRYGWPPHPHPPPGAHGGGRRKAPDGVAAPPVPKVRRARKAAVAPREPSHAACNPLPLALPTPRFAGCQFPLTDARPWRFCGQPIFKGAWCRQHYGVCYHRSARQELVPA